MARLSAELQESRTEISVGATALENAHEHARILGTQLAELRCSSPPSGPFLPPIPPPLPTLLDSFWPLAWLRFHLTTHVTRTTLGRENLEVKETEYKRMWSTEEERIKNLSDEARRQVEGVRARLIGGLERIDLSNRSMIEASQTLQSIDKDLDTLFGEGALATTSAGLSDWA